MLTVVAQRVRHREVEISVAVKIGGNDGNRLVASSVVNCFLKGSVAISQKNRHPTTGTTKRDHRQIELPVVVEVAYRYRDRAGPSHGGEAATGLKLGARRTSKSNQRNDDRQKNSRGSQVPNQGRPQWLGKAQGGGNSSQELSTGNADLEG